MLTLWIQNIYTFNYTQILEFDNDLDTDSDNEDATKSKHKFSTQGEARVQSFYLTNSSERLKASLNNCAAWLQSSVASPTLNKSDEEFNATKSKGATPTSAPKTINLPDMSQPPPPLISNYKSLAAAPPPPPSHPPPPPPPPPPPQPKEHRASTPPKEAKSETKLSLKEKERERSKKGLPLVRPHHACICSRTLWLGHLAKSTTESFLSEELAEMMTSSDSDRKSSSKKSSKSKQNVIIDVHVS